MGRRKRTTKIRKCDGVGSRNGVMLEGEEEEIKGNREALVSDDKALICSEEPSKADADA